MFPKNIHFLDPGLFLDLNLALPLMWINHWSNVKVSASGLPSLGLEEIAPMHQVSNGSAVIKHNTE